MIRMHSVHVVVIIVVIVGSGSTHVVKTSERVVGHHLLKLLLLHHHHHHVSVRVHHHLILLAKWVFGQIGSFRVENKSVEIVHLFEIKERKLTNQFKVLFHCPQLSNKA